MNLIGLRRAAFLLLLAVLVLVFEASFALAQESRYSLVIESPFSKLPARGEYSIFVALRGPSGYVDFPPNTTIVLGVDNPRILSVETPVLEVGGRRLVEVRVRTGEPGTATISAELVGAQAEKALFTIDVVEPAGKPYALSVSVLPDSVLLGEEARLVVGVRDYYGNPVTAPRDVPVSLFEYPLGVISYLEANTRIPAGHLYSYAKLRVGNVTGSAFVVGSSCCLASSAPSSVRAGRSQPKILVTLMPDNMVADKKSKIMILVQLVDSNGRPITPESPITVYVCSSNNTVLQVLTPKLVVQPGSDHAVGEAILGWLNGTATITAHASGFESGHADFESISPSQLAGEGGPVSLRIYTPPVIAVGQEYPIVVALVTAGGHVYKPDFGYNVSMTSSNPSVVRLAAVNATLYYGLAYASNHVVGAGMSETEENSAVLTACCVTTNFGVASGSVEVSVARPGYYRGGRPYSIEVLGPPVALVGEPTLYAIRLVDEFGEPAPAPKAMKINVFLSPSVNYSRCPVTIIVKEGASHAYFVLNATEEAELTITAVGEGLAPGELRVSTSRGAEPPLLDLHLAAIPETLVAGSKTPWYLYVYVTDADDNPWILGRPLRVTLTSNYSWLAVPPSVIIPRNSFYARVMLAPPPHAVNASITASAESTSTSIGVSAVEMPLEVRVLGLPEVLEPKKMYKLIVEATSLGLPVRGVRIDIASEKGVLSNSTVFTGPDGTATLTYMLPEKGLRDTIRIIAEKPGYSVASLELTALSVVGSVKLQVRVLSSVLKKPIKNVNVALFSNGNLVASAKTDEQGVAVLTVPVGTYKLVLPSKVAVSPGARAIFHSAPGLANKNEALLDVKSPLNVTAYYSVFYRVTASSPYGEVVGAGEYPEGTSVRVSVKPTVTSEFPIRHVFRAWTGTVKSSSPTVTVVVDKPVTLIAVWEPDYTLAYAVGAVVAIAAAIAMFVYINRRRLRRVEETEELEEEEVTE